MSQIMEEAAKYKNIIIVASVCLGVCMILICVCIGLYRKYYSKKIKENEEAEVTVPEAQLGTDRRVG